MSETPHQEELPVAAAGSYTPERLAAMLHVAEAYAGEVVVQPFDPSVNTEAEQYLAIAQKRETATKRLGEPLPFAGEQGSANVIDGAILKGNMLAVIRKRGQMTRQDGRLNPELGDFWVAVDEETSRARPGAGKELLH